ncbi:hypothetical protein JC221_015 [Yersinia phage JC221]|nr:hypothetical protein JC221_015 [Yersinia phage JC221]
MQIKINKYQVKIIDSFFNDITPGKVYNVINKPGMRITTDQGIEFDLNGEYNRENDVVEYVIIGEF